MQEIPIVLIGHKDHGKSTFIGRLLLDTKSIKESRVKEVKEVDKSDGRKFELAHLLDSFKEERDREMTMDTTRAFLKGKERNYQLIDVPGHGELIANMLTGAAGAEVALLLVDIKEGIREQTRQHLEVAHLLGIEQLGVVINKMDKVGYKKEAFDKIKEKLKAALNDIGYLSEKIHFFPVSAWKGDNVFKKSENMNWYQGPTVMEFLEKEVKESKSLESSPLLFNCQDNYDGLLIGKVESGVLKVGQGVIVLPQNKQGVVEAIKDSEADFKEARAGQNVGIRVVGKNLESVSLSRGTAVVAYQSPLKVDQVLVGEIFWLEKPSQKKLILECGTAKTAGFLQEVGLVRQGKKSSYKVLLEKPTVFDPTGNTIFGKIVLKDKGKIIGVGNVL